jgi:biotin carboxyl carrier protein
MKVHVKIGVHIFEVEIENTNTRPIIARVEGEEFEVWPENSMQARGEDDEAGISPKVAKNLAIQPAPTSGATTSSTLAGKTLVAPLPGNVIEVFVSPGEHVEAGHVMLVIEAMKMKNSIRSVRAGTVATVLVNVGQTVAHRQPLIEFTD